MNPDLLCETCQAPLSVVQDESFGRLLVCSGGHWWSHDFTTLQLDRLYKGEKHAA